MGRNPPWRGRWASRPARRVSSPKSSFRGRYKPRGGKLRKPFRMVGAKPRPRRY